jgi:hypothetical protein
VVETQALGLGGGARRSHGVGDEGEAVASLSSGGAVKSTVKTVATFRRWLRTLLGSV